MSVQGERAFAPFDVIPSALAVLDEAGTIVYTNAASQRYGDQNGIETDYSAIGVDYLGVCGRDGATDGELSVTIDPRQFDADDGSAFEPARAAVDADGAGATADGPGTAGTASGGSGSLSMGLVVVAASVVAVWLRRRGGER